MLKWFFMDRDIKMVLFGSRFLIFLWIEIFKWFFIWIQIFKWFFMDRYIQMVLYGSRFFIFLWIEIFKWFFMDRDIQMVFFYGFRCVNGSLWIHMFKWFFMDSDFWFFYGSRYSNGLLEYGESFNWNSFSGRLTYQTASKYYKT